MIVLGPGDVNSGMSCGPLARAMFGNGSLWWAHCWCTSAMPTFPWFWGCAGVRSLVCSDESDRPPLRKVTPVAGCGASLWLHI